MNSAMRESAPVPGNDRRLEGAPVSSALPLDDAKGLSRLAILVVENLGTAWLVLAAALIAAGIAATYLTRHTLQQERLSLLQTDAQRHGIELMSLTLNGNLMGAASLLGLVDQDIKREAVGDGKPNSPRMSALLEAVSHAHEAQGVFLVGQEGVVGSSWDNSGKPSTGLNVRFRPYFKMALQGKENVYAAVSLARGDRALYFSAPIHDGATKESGAIGAVVARTDSGRIDRLLPPMADDALLLSPQGVVFASSRKEWIGFLAGEPTAQRLKEIRELKQFGNMFEGRDPSALPIPVRDGIWSLDGREFAVAEAPVQWNDPSGDWHLVLLEDLGRSVPLAVSLRVAAAAVVALFVLAMLMLKLLRSQHAQALATGQLRLHALAQESMVRRKSQLAAAALRLQQTTDAPGLAAAFLEEAHGIFGALQGTVYLATSGSANRLRLAASYACAEPPEEELAVGEGLLGQCLQDMQQRIVELPEDGRWRIRSGLGQVLPQALVMMPILLRDVALGVLEVALLQRPDRDAEEQFSDLVALLALNLEVSARHQSQRSPSIVVTDALSSAATAPADFLESEK